MSEEERKSARCVVCLDRIEYLDPTGDGLAAWWAHEHHPADHHNAVPPVEAS